MGALQQGLLILISLFVCGLLLKGEFWAKKEDPVHQSVAPIPCNMWQQYEFTLPPFKRGCHLVTDKVGVAGWTLDPCFGGARCKMIMWMPTMHMIVSGDPPLALVCLT